MRMFTEENMKAAEHNFFERRGFHPDKNTWRDAQYGSELRIFLAGAAHSQDQLAEALEVIRFYGEPENWMTKNKDTWNRASPKDHGDKSLIVDYRHPNKDWVGTIVVGGKRAREFLARIEG